MRIKSLAVRRYSFATAKSSIADMDRNFATSPFTPYWKGVSSSNCTCLSFGAAAFCSYLSVLHHTWCDTSVIWASQVQATARVKVLRSTRLSGCSFTCRKCTSDLFHCPQLSHQNPIEFSPLCASVACPLRDSTDSCGINYSLLSPVVQSLPLFSANVPQTLRHALATEVDTKDVELNEEVDNLDVPAENAVGEIPETKEKADEVALKHKSASMSGWLLSLALTHS
eukprot:6476570-Amphidinium_carterae.1